VLTSQTRSTTHGSVRRANKLWAYPWMIMVLIGFVAFQGYEFVHVPTVGLAVLTLFDLAMVALTGREYRHQRRARRSQGQCGANAHPGHPDDIAQVRLSVGNSSSS
jgi:hypothetical protein